MSRKSYSRSFLALATVALCAQAEATVISREFSATWIDPAHAGHGFNIEVVGQGNDKTMLVYWYTYDAAGRPSWVVANGRVNGESVRLDAYTAEGGAPGTGFNPANVRLVNWGTLNVQFADCNSGTVAFQPSVAGLPSGTVAISRLTQLHNTTCSGGLSGLTPSNASVTEITQFLANKGIYAAAQAKAQFEERAERSEFKVEAEDVPAGSYAVRVGGVIRGSLVAAAGPNGIEGELEFRSPVEPGKILLDFDPRNALVEILEGDRVLFASVLDGTPILGGGDDDGNDDGSGDDDGNDDGSGDDDGGGGDDDGGGDDNGGGDDDGGGDDNGGGGGDDDGGGDDNGGGGDDDCDGSNNNNDDCNDDDHGGGDPVAGSPPFGNASYSLSVEPQGNDGPELKAELEQRAARVDFSVELEDLPAGNYTLKVGGAEQGSIAVVTVTGGTAGELEFRNPVEAGKEPLDFDPRGKLIEIEQGGLVKISGMFPSTPD